MNIITNSDILKEDTKTADLFDFSEIHAQLRSKINSFASNTMMGIKGSYGSCKSHALEQLKNKAPNDEIWITFDAWQFPDRKDLWEGFLFEVVKQTKSEDVEEVKQKVDGQTSDQTKAVQAMNRSISHISMGMIPDLSALFNTSPIKRVYEIQELLKKYLLEKLDKSIKRVVIVVEDIDRTDKLHGDIFLETLSHFIRNNELLKTIIVLAPVGDQYFEERKDQYKKVFDVDYEFRLSDLDFVPFLKEVFTKDFFGEHKDEVISYVFKKLGFKTIRDFKYGLRGLCTFHSGLDEGIKEEVDPLVLAIMYLRHKTGHRIHPVKHEEDGRYSERLYLNDGELANMLGVIAERDVDFTTSPEIRLVDMPKMCRMDPQGVLILSKRYSDLVSNT